jgi:predicted MFS family arabinose efflux permease
MHVPMLIMAQSWLVLDLSQKAKYLGIDQFLGQIPIVLFSLVGGVLADRTERQKILIFSQVVQLTCAFLLTALYSTHVVVVWNIWTLSFIVGIAQAFGGPAYQALIPSLVKKEDLSNAIALNSIQFNLARVIGPSLGGLAMTTLGVAWCFSLNGLSFFAVIISLLVIRPPFVPVKTGESVLTSMKKGFTFMLTHGAMEGLILLAFSMTLFAFPVISFLPVMARDVFHGGPQAYTVLLVCSGVGSICGALIVAGLGKFKHQGRVTLMMLIVLGGLLSGFALSRSLIIGGALIFLAAGMLMGVFATVSSLVQTITPDDMRGRVMSVYNVAFRGGMPIGSLVVGVLVDRFTAPIVLAWNGVLLATLGLYYLAFQRKVAAL